MRKARKNLPFTVPLLGPLLGEHVLWHTGADRTPEGRVDPAESAAAVRPFDRRILSATPLLVGRAEITLKLGGLSHGDGVEVVGLGEMLRYGVGGCGSECQRASLL